MRRPAPAWVVPAMRAGYLARATVFGLVGFLVIRAAWHGGYPGGPEEALVSLADRGLGGTLLWGVAAGAVGFALWCMMAATMDFDRRGTGAAGILARLDFAGTGALYAIIAVVVGELAWTGLALPGGDEELVSAARLGSFRCRREAGLSSERERASSRQGFGSPMKASPVDIVSACAMRP